MSLMHGVSRAVGRALRPVQAGDQKLAVRDPSLGEQGARLDVGSPAVAEGQRLPERYTADGDGIALPLRWSAPPEGTRELVLLCEDPDAPMPRPFVHWVAYGIPPDARELPEGLSPVGRPGAAGVRQGRNTMRKLGYTPAAPPPGHGVHHYHFELFALDAPLDLDDAADRDDVVRSMTGHVLARGELVATYER